MYWENKKTQKPEYLDLCYDTIKKHNEKDFNVVLK